MVMSAQELTAELAEGTAVKFQISDEIYGEGVICGKHTVEMPVVGAGYVIRYTKLSIEHVYSTLSAFRCQITVI